MPVRRQAGFVYAHSSRKLPVKSFYLRAVQFQWHGLAGTSPPRLPPTSGWTVSVPVGVLSLVREYGRQSGDFD